MSHLFHCQLVGGVCVCVRIDITLKQIFLSATWKHRILELEGHTESSSSIILPVQYYLP